MGVCKGLAINACFGPLRLGAAYALNMPRSAACVRCPRFPPVKPYFPVYLFCLLTIFFFNCAPVWRVPCRRAKFPLCPDGRCTLFHTRITFVSTRRQGKKGDLDKAYRVDKALAAAEAKRLIALERRQEEDAYLLSREYDDDYDDQVLKQ